MAALIKRPASPNWIACFDVTQPDGTSRRLKKSTKRAKPSEAMAEAIRIEETERKTSMATSPTASKAFAILSEAAEAAARGELSVGRAREFIARLCEVSTGTAMKFHTVRTWAEDWQAMNAASSKKITRARYNIR